MLLEKQLDNGLREYKVTKPEYKNAKISLPKHYYQNTPITRDKIKDAKTTESKDKKNGISRKACEYSTKVIKKVNIMYIVVGLHKRLKTHLIKNDF